MGKPTKSSKPKRKYTRKNKPEANTRQTLTKKQVEKLTQPVTQHPALQRLTSFLEAWKAQDWEAMSNCCQLTWLEIGHPCCTAEGWLETNYGMMNLRSFDIDPEPEKVREWEYMLAFNVKADIENIKGLKAAMKINVVFENIPQEPEKDMSSETGEWGANPISSLNIQWSE